MERNYFLSYSQIALLLLLSTVGKLNARIISVTMSKPELLHYTDIKGTDLSPYLSDTFSQQSMGFVGCEFNNHLKLNHDSHRPVLKELLQNNLPIVNDLNFFLSPVENFNSIRVWNTLRVFSVIDYTDVLRVKKQIKRFYINSAKLMDGFKFIIKIPDKPNVHSLK